MIFGEFPIDEAEGVALAHTQAVGARSFKKGRRLSAADVELLRQAGIASVAGARLQEGDASEDEGAMQIAAALVGENTETRAPYTGRCNVHASARGVVVVDEAAIDRLNLVDEAVTVGTLPQYALVRKPQVVATVKIIPFAVSRAVLERCREAVGPRPPLRVAAMRSRRAALIMSELPGMKEKVFQATVAATRNRLESLGSRLALELRVAHDEGAVVAGVRQCLGAGCDLVLVSGATVTKDRADIVPSAIVAAGGTVEHFGMPVEPGNMLLLAHIGPVPVINLPGCARSRRLNGLDWVLQRMLADLPISRRDIMRMGVGGLIRSPLESDDNEDAESPAQAAALQAGPRIAALVLAAGRSSRMGANKLLAEVDGIPMVLRAVNAARAARVSEVVVVTGHEAERIEALLAGRGARVVRNPDYENGMSTSLRRGLDALPAECEGVIVLLADMPRVSADHLDRLIDAFDDKAARIVVPQKDGRRGNPVLWPRAYFGEMREVQGDQGAREVLARHANDIVAVDMPDEAIFADVDTPEALARVTEGQ